MAIETNMAYALGAGSGVDTKNLATQLVAAERLPREDAINTKIESSKAKISGFGAMAAILSSLKQEFEGLNQRTDFNDFATYNSAEAAFSVTTTSEASPGTHSINVLSLAVAQRNASSGVAEPTTPLNGTSAMSVALSIGGADPVSIRIASSQATPEGVVQAINAAGLGVSASLLNTGDGSDAPYRIVLAGELGEDNAFTLTSDNAQGSGEQQDIQFTAATAAGTMSVGGVSVDVVAGESAASIAAKVKSALEQDALVTNVIGRSVSVSGDTLSFTFAASDGYKDDLAVVVGTTGVTAQVSEVSAFVAGSEVTGLDFSNQLQAASDASVSVDGLVISRPTNEIDDVLTGMTLELRATTSQAASLTLNRDMTPLKDKLNALVTTYNAAISDFAVLMGPKNEDDPDDIYSGSLAGNATARMILANIKGMITGTSDAASNGVNALRDLGVDLARDGTLSLDETKLTTVVNSNFTDVVSMLSANARIQTLTADVPRGVAGGAVKQITDMLKSGSAILTQSASAETKITGYEADLAELDTRMEALLARYTKQFATMDAIVGQITSTREGLVGQFEALAEAYKK